MKETIQSFGFALRARQDETRLCTRGLNTYNGDVRAFAYLTPKIRITPADLDAKLLASRSFHLICSPRRCIEIIEYLQLRRQAQGIIAKLLTIWEPVPDACFHTQEQWQAFQQAMQQVSVVSPNAHELCGILGVDPPAADEHEQTALSELTQKLGQHCSVLVVRAGHLGTLHSSKSGTVQRTPAYFTPQDTPCIKDTTGAGNTFCGALAVALAAGLSLEEAVIRGNVAAALAIEQTGLPTLSKTGRGETWNGRDITQSLDAYRKRIESEA
jgi:sugar/nucleoside kinase (ribokinase family)